MDCSCATPVAIRQAVCLSAWVHHLLARLAGPHSPDPLGQCLGSGLQKRIEASERYLAIRPVVRCIPEDVEQLLARFLVKLGVCRNMLQHDDEAGLRARLVNQVGHAVVQRIEVLAEMRRKGVLRGDHVQNVLLALGIAQVGIQEMLVQLGGGLLQVVDAEGSYGLHDVGPYALQRCVFVLTKWCFHLRFSFY